MPELSREVMGILGILFLLYSIACIIARLTPTKKDDRIVSWIGRLINLLFKKANIKDEDIEDLKSKATAIALHDIKQKLKDIDKYELFTKAVETAAYQALMIKDDDNLRGMKMFLGADVEVGLAALVEGRVMHTRLGRRIQKKLLRRKIS